jgi:3-hydroxyisobutyrate dehydrogenase-like beta-hydroxyacid dehydrogenase
MMPYHVEKVGFLGLGKMGAPMARNIMKAGFELSVYNRTPAKMNPLVQLGALGTDTPMKAAMGTDVVFSCLMDDQSMMDVVLGDNGLLGGLRRGGIHIGTATISLGCAVKLSELHRTHGSHYLAAPIFGRPNAAEQGTLLTYIAGNAEVTEACEGLFKTYSRSQVYVGEDYRIANSIKLTFNFMLIALIEMFSEVIVLAEKSGIGSEMMSELITSVLAHPALKEYVTRMHYRDFEPAFELRAGFKDVELMLQASSEALSPLPIARLVREKFLTALAHGMADMDWSAIYEVTRKSAGLDWA